MTHYAQRPTAAIRLLQACPQKGLVGGTFHVTFTNPLPEAVTIQEAKVIIRWGEDLTADDDGKVVCRDYPVPPGEKVPFTVQHKTQSPDYGVPREAEVCFLWSHGRQARGAARGTCSLGQR